MAAGASVLQTARRTERRAGRDALLRRAQSLPAGLSRAGDHGTLPAHRVVQDAGRSSLQPRSFRALRKKPGNQDTLPHVSSLPLIQSCDKQSGESLQLRLHECVRRRLLSDRRIGIPKLASKNQNFHVFLQELCCLAFPWMHVQKGATFVSVFRNPKHFIFRHCTW